MLIETHGNKFAAIDFELNGGRAGIDEPLQVGICVYDETLTPTGDVFDELLRPGRLLNAEAAAVHGLTENQLRSAPAPDRVADMLFDWFDSLRLLPGKRLIPIAHNWAVECATLYAWLGYGATHSVFHVVPRCSLSLASGLRDAGVSFPQGVGLSALCNQFNVTNDNPHNALSDAKATAEIYKIMVNALA